MRYLSLFVFSCTSSFLDRQASSAPCFTRKNEGDRFLSEEVHHLKLVWLIPPMEKSHQSIRRKKVGLNQHLKGSLQKIKAGCPDASNQGFIHHFPVEQFPALLNTMTDKALFPFQHERSHLHSVKNLHRGLYSLLHQCLHPIPACIPRRFLRSP